MESGTAVLFTGRLDEQDALCRALDLPVTTESVKAVGQAYRRWGPHDFASHLYGDFAIVLWEGPAKRLVLTRSPSGLHPLCYRQCGPELRFASVPELLLGRADTPALLDEQALAEWLVLRPRLSDHTLFAGIRWVPPGSSVLYERVQVTLSRNWRPEALGTLHLRDHREYADALRETLQTAVIDRLRETQGNVASQLSGGLDSSSVTALAAEHLATSGRSVFAFTAVPGSRFQSPMSGRFFDESNHAAAVAARYGNIVHTCVTTEEAPLLEVLDRYTDVGSGPPFNPHHLQWIDRTYAAAANSGATTLLTGSMGNTTISGAGSLAIMDALQHGRFAHSARLFAASRASGTRGLRNIPGVLLTAFAPRLLDVSDRLRGVRMGPEEFTGVRPAFARAMGMDLARWNRRLPFRTAREQDLASLDRFDFGMFHEAPRRLYGLDATDPTYDRRVVELTLRIPLEQFCAGGVPRALIRTAMEGRLPDIVRLERRRGLQSADFLNMLERERAGIAEELAGMEQIDVLRRAFDLPLVRERLHWPAKKAIQYGWHQYSNRLMRVLSMGRFVRRMTEGSLFSTLPETRQDSAGTVHVQM